MPQEARAGKRKTEAGKMLEACARETGLSLPTIRRHWNGENAKERTEGAAYENDGSDSRGGRGHKVRNI
jgi:hypothetical protein